MKRFWFPLLVAAAFVGGIIASCQQFDLETAAKNIKMSDFKFGYYAKPEFDLSSVSSWMVNTNGDENYICFTSEEEIEDIRSGKYKSMLSSTAAARQDIIDSANFKNSRLEFSFEPIELYVEPFPKKAVVHTVEVESLNPDIVEVIPKKDYDKYGYDAAEFSLVKNRVLVKCHKLGEVEFVVKVTGLTFTETRHYKVRCVATLKPYFLITNKILSKTGSMGYPFGCRIWLTFFGVPEGIFTDYPLIYVRDSVSVFSYCEYYDFHRAGRKPLVYRDTVGIPPIGRFVLPYPLQLRQLHGVDLTAVMISMEGYQPAQVYGTHKFVYGEQLVWNPLKAQYDTLQHIPYMVLVDQVKLSWEVYSDNPFLEFKASTFSFLSPTKKEYDYASYVGVDSTSMSVGNIEECTKIDRVWFDLELITKYTPNQLDSVSKDIAKFRKSSGIGDLINPDPEKVTQYEDRANEEAENQKKYW